MPYKRWDFENPVEKNTDLVAVYDCSPDWGSITYLDGGQEKTYEFKDETDFNILYSPNNNSQSADFRFYDVTVPRNNVTKITIGKNVTTIKNFFATYCKGLVTVELPLNLSSIGTYFLYNDTALDCEFNLPESCVLIGDYFLNNCTKFNSKVSFANENCVLGSRFMHYCSNFNQEIVLPRNITTIPNDFLYYCSKFNQMLSVPESVTSIGNNFLAYCQVFNQKITLPDGLTSIGDSFLSGCYKFDYPVTVPSGVVTIKNSFLSSCSVLNSDVEFLGDVISVGNSFMSGCSKFNSSVRLDLTKLQSIGSNFMSSCSAWTQPIIFPPQFTEMPNQFHSYNTSFNLPVEIPSSYTKLNGFAYGWESFTQPVTIPEAVTDLGDFFFGYAKRYNSPIKLPSSLEKIGTSFMSGCYSYTQKIEFPEDVVISSNNFMCNCVNYPYFSDIVFDQKHFPDTKWNYMFYGWVYYDGDIVIPSHVTELECSFVNLINAKSLTIPETVTKITVYYPGEQFCLNTYSSNYDSLYPEIIRSTANAKYPSYTIFVDCNMSAFNSADKSAYAIFAVEGNGVKEPKGDGVKISGKNAAALKQLFPDSQYVYSNVYYTRKLVIVDDPRTT